MNSLKYYGETLSVGGGITQHEINVPSDCREIIAVIFTNGRNTGDNKVDLTIDNRIVYSGVECFLFNQNSNPLGEVFYPLFQPFQPNSTLKATIERGAITTQDCIVVYSTARSNKTPRRLLGIDVPVFIGTQSNRVKFDNPVSKIIGVLAANNITVKLDLTVNNNQIIDGVDGSIFALQQNGICTLNVPINGNDNVFAIQSGNQTQPGAQIVFYYE